MCLSLFQHGLTPLLCTVFELMSSSVLNIFEEFVNNLHRSGLE